MNLEAYRLVCRSLDVPDPGCHGFEFNIDHKTITGFIVHWRGKWYGYENRCPHTGASLNWQPDQFLDWAQEFLMCGIHGALFQPQNGLCVRGPCVGQSLSALPVREQGGDILVDCSALVAA